MDYRGMAQVKPGYHKEPPGPLYLPPVPRKAPCMTLLELANLLMTPHQTATFLKVTITTLEDWRRKGTGPKYRRMNGRVVRYFMTDVEEWLKESSAPVTGPAKGTPRASRRSSLCIES